MPNPPRLLTHDGVTRTLDEWAALIKVPPSTLRARLDKLDWSVEQAVTTPADRRFGGTKKQPLGVPRPCPALKEHSTGQAYCQWYTAGQRQVKYFGPWASDQAARRYRRFQAEWAAGGADRPKPGQAVFVAELAERFIEYAGGYYQKNGKVTSEYYGFQAAISALNDLYGDGRADEFEPDQLRAFVAALVGRGYVRKTCNEYRRRVVQMFGWGVGRKLVPPAVVHVLERVERLQPGRTAAPDRPKKRAVPIADVEKSLPYLHTRPSPRAVFEALVRVQLLTGMRPGELCRMRPTDLNRSGDLWRYEDAEHKNQHRGKSRVVWIGPQAQAVLAPLLADCPPDVPVFSYPRTKDGSRVGITVRSLHARVAAACKRAGVPHWHPHLVRHSRATEVQRRYECDDAAAAAIGDSPETARQIYADDPTEAVAKRIARELG